MAKRSSLFGTQAAASKAAPAVEPIGAAEPAGDVRDVKRYPIAKTREGKRVATVYLEPEALKALQRITIDEDTSLQALLVEGVNAVFQARGLSRIA